jgi:4-methyl-5(b-hydroxyethyl)-thiazole monophosphate biosynthesis
MGKKICVLFGGGVEEIEIVTPVDILRRGGVEVTLASAGDSLEVSGAHGVGLIAEVAVDGVNPASFDALLLPGGPGSFTMKDDAATLAAVRKFHSAGKLLCAICAAPLILRSADALGKRKFCCHPCAYDTLEGADRNARVVVDGNLITAKGPGAAADFAFAILEFLRDAAAAAKLRSEMFF